MIESNPSATFSLIFRITNLQNLLASRLKIPWRPIKPRPLDLQGPIFVSSSPSQASVMQRRLNGAVSEKKKNSFPVHNLRSDDHHKSIIYASSATQSSRIPSFLKPRPHATEGPWLLLPPHPSKKKKEPLPSEVISFSRNFTKLAFLSFSEHNACSHSCTDPSHRKHSQSWNTLHIYPDESSFEVGSSIPHLQQPPGRYLVYAFYPKC